jgi:hypothetical protein
MVRFKRLFLPCRLTSLFVVAALSSIAEVIAPGSAMAQLVAEHPRQKIVEAFVNRPQQNGRAGEPMPPLRERMRAAAFTRAFGGDLVLPFHTAKFFDATGPGTRRFTTSFSDLERPVSAGGAWHHLGTFWSLVRSADGHAMGTQTGSRGYDDSYAYLSGFGPDQTVRATLWFDRTDDGDYREVELLLRWSDSRDSARGYECNLAWSGAYAEIVRWNGAPGNFTYITRQRRFDAGIMPPATGDVLEATIAGSVIRVYLDKNDGKGDRLIAIGRDETFKDGGPGLGLFIQGNVDPSRFGFTDFSATSD